MTESRIYILHENDEWMSPFYRAFEQAGLPFEPWFIDRRYLDLNAVPPQGVFWSRFSASCYTRDHLLTPMAAENIFYWLVSHQRRVVNGVFALRLEVSKAAQQVSLDAAGFDVPRSIAVFGKDQLLSAAEQLALTPMIVKPNQGGKGLGVERFESVAELEKAVQFGTLGESIDDCFLVQENLDNANDFITRMEFIGGRFHYAIRVYTGGSFLLCPAESCSTDTGSAGFCMTDSETDIGGNNTTRFEIDAGFNSPLIQKIENWLSQNSLEVAGVEFMQTKNGRSVIYDVNTNTNYNTDAEIAAGVQSGAARMAEFLGSL